MNSDIETILRHPPKVKVPADLLGDLQRDVSLPGRMAYSGSVAVPFWKRWLPAFSIGLLMLGCLGALGLQTAELFQLQQENEALRQAAQSVPTEPAPLETPSALAQDQEELQRLRAEVEQLRADLQVLPDLRAQQAQLREQLKTATDRAAAEDPFARGRAKADSVACINNLKQIGLAARMWANDHGDTFPTDFISLRKEMPTPKILVCPADAAKLPAPSQWEQFDPSHVSYEFFGATAQETDPYTVLTRCTIHGNVGLADGSAHMNSGNNLNLVTENGRLRLARSKP